MHLPSYTSSVKKSKVLNASVAPMQRIVQKNPLTVVAPVIINKNNATCEDVLKLIRKVKAVVKEKTGYTLHCEVMMIKSDGVRTYSVAAE